MFGGLDIGVLALRKFGAQAHVNFYVEASAVLRELAVQNRCPKRVLNGLGLPINIAARYTPKITKEQARVTDLLAAFVKEELAGL